MYLSRLILEPRNRRVQSEVADAYQMHRSVMHAFPDDLGVESERVLFRLESGHREDPLTLLVQSWQQPDWSWLSEPNVRGYLLPTAEPNPWVKAFDLHLEPGQVLVFRLRANPTVKRTTQRGNKRLGLCRESDQIEWLQRKAEQGGFRLLSVRLSQQGMVQGRVRREQGRHRMQLLSVQFDGFLEVTDPARLLDSVQQGIGSAKGLGFGLLSLGPAPD